MQSAYVISQRKAVSVCQYARNDSFILYVGSEGPDQPAHAQADLGLRCPQMPIKLPFLTAWIAYRYTQQLQHLCINLLHMIIHFLHQCPVVMVIYLSDFLT